MLSIGEFSNICKVSTKTLRYYAEIGLLKPTEINPENGYRYYAIEQLETMLFINRLKSYKFSMVLIQIWLLSMQNSVNGQRKKDMNVIMLFMKCMSMTQVKLRMKEN